MMKIESINNDQITLLTVDGAAVKVRALPMSDAVAWAALATAARLAVDAAATYEDMRDAMVECASALTEYPGLTAEVVAKCTTEQLTGALEALLEVNDPFARRRRQAAHEAEKAEARGMEMAAKLPPESLRMILERSMDATSAQSVLNSISTPS